MYKLALALRYLVKRRIAYISIVAIAFGLMAMIVVSSVMEGFQRRIRSSIYRVDGALTIGVDDLSIMNGSRHYDVVLDRIAPWLAENGGPITATSKRVLQPAMLSTSAGGDPSIPQSVRREFVTVIGVDAELERRVLPLAEMLEDVEDPRRRVPDAHAERLFDYRRGEGPVALEPGILLGVRLAEVLGVWRGDRITLVSAVAVDGSEGVGTFEPVTRSFVVVGCFRSGRYDYDRELALCSGRELQTLLRLPNDCSRVVARIEDPEDAGLVKAEILAREGFGIAPLFVRTWEDRMRSFASALEFERLAMLIVLACIVVVAGASICGILYMVVLEKTRDIGILLSMGATSSGVVGIFLLYGGMLGLIGTVLGLVLGHQVVEHLDAIIGFVERVTGADLFPSNVYEFESLPTYFQLGEALAFGGATFAFCVVSSMLPAFRAARLDPVRCLAYE